MCPEVFLPVGELDQVLGEDNKQSGSTYGQVYYCKLGSGVKVLLIFTARAQWEWELRFVVTDPVAHLFLEVQRGEYLSQAHKLIY